MSVAAPVKAADLTQFRPGNIISDAVFFNRSTMTEAQIQSFLEARVPSCRAGYTCLKDYYDNTRAIAADLMCGAYAGGERERASRIIYKVAQACGINPQVLIVMLQKEQGLITTTQPSAWNYQAAMGQGCPDTAACDARYHGLFNQIYGAAWQMKRYANPPGTGMVFTWYAPGKTWNIRYSPNAACGSSPVYIENQATANLYYYTPYQPNAASLRAGYGTGDACSSYGNRNFYNYFTDWFGSTLTGAALPSITTLDSGSYVLAVNTGGDLWAYPGNGRSSWLAPAKIGVGWGSFKTIVAVGDLDRDGHRDLLAVATDGAVLMYRGDGGLSFHAPATLPHNWGQALHIAAAGDFDRDGFPDVFTVDPDGSLQLWRGDGSGGLRDAVRVGNGWNMMNLLIGTGDFDGDGQSDLVARGTDGRLYLGTGNGRGGWLGVRAIGNGWQSMTSIVSPGDFTGDGRADLLARAPGGAMLLYAGTGGGGLSSVGQIGSGWQGMVLLTGSGGQPGQPRVAEPGPGDIDGDAARDVLAVDPAGALTLYRGDGAGAWRGIAAIDTQWGRDSRTFAMGDFNGDGHPDVGQIRADGTLLLHPGTGTGLGTPVTIGNGWSSLNHVFGAIDFDGDRRMDVLARNSTGALIVYRGDGAGGWASISTVGSGWSSMTAIFAAGDFDGDGASDVIARTSAGALMLYPTDGRGSWKTPRQIGNGWGGFDHLFSPGDFDGTGGTDVLARTTAGALLLYRGDGRGGWLGQRAIGNGWTGMLIAG